MQTQKIWSYFWPYSLICLLLGCQSETSVPTTIPAEGLEATVEGSNVPAETEAGNAATEPETAEAVGEVDSAQSVEPGDEAEMLNGAEGQDEAEPVAETEPVQEDLLAEDDVTGALEDNANPPQSNAVNPAFGGEATAASNSLDPFSANAASGNSTQSNQAGSAASNGQAMNAVAVAEPSALITNSTQNAEPPLNAAANAAAPVAKAAASSSQTQDAADNDVDPSNSLVHWVGYRVAEKEKQLKIEIMSQGNPDFEIFEETNKASQLEIVLRFYQSRLRRKIHWDINSSEFRSPVAYIRMREFKDKNTVDVVLTHRDAVLPMFYSSSGRMILVYGIPERYFNNAVPTARVVKEKAVSLVAGAPQPLNPRPIPLAKGPENLGRQRGRLFQATPSKLVPLRDVIRSQGHEMLDKQGLPADFQRNSEPIQGRAAAFYIDEFSLSAVAQDNVSGEDETVETNNTVIQDSAANGQSDAANTEEVTEANTANVENVPSNTENSAGVEVENGALEAASIPAVEEAAPADNAASKSSPAKNPLAVPAANVAEPVPEQIANPATEALEAAPAQAEDLVPPPDNSAVGVPPIEMTGDASASPSEQYVGKPVFMEYYEAQLSTVLRSFSEETGNNFIYSSPVGAILVSAQFKGVPWDEALKAILETHGLGMVRIGENVVRIDFIVKLTEYMRSLEDAKSFETRRIPTKVLVFRLNNGVAKDIAERLLRLLDQDIQNDKRTKIQDDIRTNSIVMEAIPAILGKAKAIIERLDLETPQVEIASRIVEVKKDQNNFAGFSWGSSLNFDPGRALGFGALNFPNSIGSTFSVDPGVQNASTAGLSRFRFGSLNKFIDLDLLLRLEEKKGSTNVLQSNRVLVLDGQKASILAGNSSFFRPAAGTTVPAPGQAGGAGAAVNNVGLVEIQFNLSLDVKPQITALGAVIMDLVIKSDTPGTTIGESLANKNTRELKTQMVRNSGDTGVIGGIYDTKRTSAMTGVPFLSDLPILGALFRSTQSTETQTELLIMVTPTIVSGRSTGEEVAEETASIRKSDVKEISIKNTGSKVKTRL